MASVFSRGGFTDGYFTEKLFSAMTGVRSDEDKKASRDIKGEPLSLSKIPIKAKAIFKRGEKCQLSFTATLVSRWGDTSSEPISVCAFGEIPNEAQNAPLTKDGLFERLSKMGSTPFAFGKEDIEIELDEGINLPPSQINALRREASEKLLAEYSLPLAKLVSDEREIFTSESVEIDLYLPTYNYRKFL